MCDLTFWPCFGEKKRDKEWADKKRYVDPLQEELNERGKESAQEKGEF